MSAELIQILPNLGVGVVAVLGLIYVIRYGLEKAEQLHTTHVSNLNRLHASYAEQIKEGQTSIREIEKEVRTSVMKQLNDNTEAFKQVLRYMDNKH